MADFFLTVGDLLPVLTDTLYLPDGTAADLTGATAEFHMAAVGGGFRRGGPATITAALTGGVEYAWEEGDTSVPPGLYRGQWRATYANGKPLSFLNDGYIMIKIQAAV